jgi:large subunit ribosomal protein L24
MAGQVKVKLRKNDNVQVISGRDRGKTGRIVRIDHVKGRAVVEGLNMVKKAVKQRKQNQKAGITSVEAPIGLAKLMIVCRHCKKPARIRWNLDGGRRTRACARCEGEL